MSKITQQKFIDNARMVHGDRYDYSDVSYTRTAVKVIINCRVHGPFLQTPNSHCGGSGCPSCSGNRKKNTDDFIRQATLVHGNKYGYDKAVYTGNHNKLIITCHHHGVDFSQEANTHLRGGGCRLCGVESSNKSKLRGFSLFLSRSQSVHGMIYQYHHDTYVNVTTKTKITCEKHGDFWKTPDKHVSGQGCPACSKFGFDQTKLAIVYFLSGDGVIKVGVTNNLPQRLSQLSRYTPFNFFLLKKINILGRDAMKIEKSFHKKYESAGLTGFDGATEWLKYSKPLMDEIMNSPKWLFIGFSLGIKVP